MAIRLFELDGKTIKPTEHCYMISWLNCIIDEYPEDHPKVLAYIYYLSYPGPDNPFFNIAEEDLIVKVGRYLNIEFDTEDLIIVRAIENCKELYMTPTFRAYQSFKKMFENLSTYLSETEFTDGRDGNVAGLLRAAKEFNSIRQSFKGVLEDVIEENKISARGSSKLPYDQRGRQ